MQRDNERFKKTKRGPHQGESRDDSYCCWNRDLASAGGVADVDSAPGFEARGGISVFGPHLEGPSVARSHVRVATERHVHEDSLHDVPCRGQILVIAVEVERPGDYGHRRAIVHLHVSVRDGVEVATGRDG